MKYKPVLSSICLTLLLSACSQSGSDDKKEASTNSEAETSPESQSNTGRFIDSAVSGLDYKTFNANGQQTSSGTTNSNGEYTYNPDGSDTHVEFFFGFYSLGLAEIAAIITPLSLIKESEAWAYHEDYALNWARFLQTVDSDGDPENGITITIETTNAFNQAYASRPNATLPNFSQASGDFAANIEAYIGEYTNTSSLVSEAAAIEHLNTSIATVGTDYTIDLNGQTWHTQLVELRQYIMHEDTGTSSTAGIYETTGSWGLVNTCTQLDMNIYSVDKYHLNYIDVEIWDEYNTGSCTRTGEKSFETANYGQYSMCNSHECSFSELNSITYNDSRTEKTTRFHVMGSDKVTTVKYKMLRHDGRWYKHVSRSVSQQIDN